MKVIYIAGFRQHAGKTVTSLGLLSLLQNYFDPKDLGYIKPVGQELVELPDGTKIDKDALIIERFTGIPDLDMKAISPVRLGKGFTKTYLSSADPDAETQRLTQDIIVAFKTLAHKKVVVCEGTGHPGVGGIVGLSNAVVSNLLNADIIYLSGGGLGKALDSLEVDFSFFHMNRSNIRGVIFNKLIQGKIETIKKFLTEDLINRKYAFFDSPVKVFGYLPLVEDLYKPSMSVIKSHFPDAHVIGNAELENWNVPCSTIRVISLTAENLKLKNYVFPGDIILIAASSRRRLMKIINHNKTFAKGKQLGGIIITCSEIAPLAAGIERVIEAAGIPALYVKELTAAAEEKVLKCMENTKIQIFDTKKVEEIKDLFQKHFDFDKFMKTFQLSGRTQGT